MSRVGVAIPVFNEERLITRSLSSFLDQNVPLDSFFLVVVDNGSSDRSVELVKDFKKSQKEIEVHLAYEKQKGTRFARKKALDMAASLGAEILASTDADSIVPIDFISIIQKTLNSLSNKALKGKIRFPLSTSFARFVKLRKVMDVVVKLRYLEEQFFGPWFSGAYCAFPKKLYIDTYLNDINNPLIPEEDHLLSKRFFYQGTKVVESSNYVTTSDRRFWGDINLWLKGPHTKDFRKMKKKEIPSITKKEIKLIILDRIRYTANRFLRQLVDALFYWTVTNNGKARKNSEIFVDSFGLPRSIVKRISFQQRFPVYNKLSHKYLDQISELVNKKITDKA